MALSLHEDASAAPLSRDRWSASTSKEQRVMASSAIITLHQVWDCKWSRPGTAIADAADALYTKAASRWVCVRGGRRLDIEETECRTCALWEPRPDALAGTHVRAHAVAPAAT